MLWHWLSPVKRAQFTKALTGRTLRAHNRHNPPCKHGVLGTKKCRDCQHGYQQAFYDRPGRREQYRAKGRQDRLIRKVAHALLVAV
jgi:hypothetical protein